MVAEALLAEVKGDPFDVDALDLHKLLDAWGFGREEVGEVQGWQASCRYHPKHPELDVVLQRAGGVSSFTVRRVVDIIERLRKKLDATQG